MKYNDLIHPDNLIFPQTITNQQGEFLSFKKSSAKDSGFVNFYLPTAWQKNVFKAYSTNWKARLSIHPEDFEKAWDLLFPILSTQLNAFKVINVHALAQIKQANQEKLEQLVNDYNNFKQYASTQAINDVELKTYYLKTVQQLQPSKYSSWRIIAFIQNCYHQLVNFFYLSCQTKAHILSTTHKHYQNLIKKAQIKQEAWLRFDEGMQITIYILPGSEKDFQILLENMETLLVTQQIRPGFIHHHDRQIGLYSSVRHPGITSYHHAITVTSYNPDNVPDPFALLTYYPLHLLDSQKRFMKEKCLEVPQYPNNNQLDKQPANQNVHFFKKNKFSQSTPADKAAHDSLSLTGKLFFS